MRLNLGCGTNKLDGYINIDVEESCKPDLIFNFLNPPLPYENKSCDEIVLFHTIEHIRKVYHEKILRECFRLLEPNGLLIISFPEFLKCVENWKTNRLGIKEKWEQTIFGRQLYPSDYHVALMHGTDLKNQLEDIGFKNVQVHTEPEEDWNTVVTAKRGRVESITHEELIKHDMERYVIVK